MMRTPRSLAIALASLSLWSALPRAAWAQDAASCAEAYESSQELRKAGKLSAARDKLIACSNAVCPGAIRKDCAQWYTEVEKAIPSVVFAAKESTGTDVLDAKLEVDGAIVSERLDGKPLSLDPGPHAVKVLLRDGRHQTMEVVVRQGVQDRLVTLTLDPVKGSTPPPLPGASTHEPEKSDSIVPAAIAGGVGVVALGASLFFQVSATSDRDRLYETCGPTRSCDPAERDTIDGKVLGARVALAVGVVALGTAVVLFLARGKPSPTRASLGRITF